MDNFKKNNHTDDTISEMETISKVDATNKKPEISHVMAEITQKFWNTLSSPAKVQDEKLRRIMLDQGKSNNTLQWKSNLHNTNFGDAIKPLPCSCSYDPDSKIICKKSEEFSENNYKDFMKMFKSTTTNIPDKTLTKKITKSVGVTSNNSNKPTTSRQVDYISTNEIMRNRFFNCKPKNSRKKLEETEEDDDFFKTKKTSNSYKNKKNKLNNEVDSCDEKINVNKPAFKTATDELKMQASKKGENLPGSLKSGQRKNLMRRAVSGKFVSPMLSNNDSDDNSSKSQEWIEQANATADENLKNIEPRMVELIKSEIMDNGASVAWDDIAGLVFAKTAIQEAVVWPMLRPDIFTGLRRPPKGILLFGPPGTGKTLIGKCVASQSKSTFFTISASSLTSKWVGEGEKMVRALFSVARCYQPSVIFIDEIDSLLSQRSDNEHESSRRIKTEFLVQLDGATTVNEERLLVIGATNRPQELDEAARRRFSKRLYIPLPEHEARVQLVKRLMSTENHELIDSDINKIADMSDGYSGADLRHLCSEACLGPIRSIDFNMMASIKTTDVRSVTIDDFKKSFTRVRSSVSPNDLNQYISWDKIYGSGTFT